MQYGTLGSSDLKVSRLCLGSMNFGEQCSEADSHAQLDYAIERGINFIDTAELYPSPPKAGSFGLTERYIGNWLKARGKRDEVVLASKVTGRSKLPWLRDWEGGTRLDARNIEAAVDGSLQRLQTDYIDLYQLHWPDRRTNIFGQIGYRPSPKDEPVPLEDTLAALGRLVEKGKIRHIGVCNETPWGLMKCLELSRLQGLPRVVSIQNQYNLISRSFEMGHAEIADREQVGLMAYAPLAMGTLTGKYAGGQRPQGARLTEFEHFERFLAPAAVEAAERYVALAREHGLDPARMALAFAAAQPFTAAVLIGASSLAQLRNNIDAVDTELDKPVLEAIEAIHQQRPSPCP
jgi:aryl-alcohol dehydrogenase-like predicted oxidoreductase